MEERALTDRETCKSCHGKRCLNKCHRSRLALGCRGVGFLRAVTSGSLGRGADLSGSGSCVAASSDLRSEAAGVFLHHHRGLLLARVRSRALTCRVRPKSPQISFERARMSNKGWRLVGLHADAPQCPGIWRCPTARSADRDGALESRPLRSRPESAPPAARARPRIKPSVPRVQDGGAGWGETLGPLAPPRPRQVPPLAQRS